MSLSSASLKSGDDYPATWKQFLDWFYQEDACLKYIENLRWPNGFICPRCDKQENLYYLSRGRIMCPSCRYQCTAKAGTLFEKTRTPLKDWFAAIWYITNQKSGISALGVCRT